MERIPEPEYMDLDEEAEAYAEADFDDVNAAFVASVLAFYGEQAAPRVLDLGCGPGDIPQRICTERPDWRVIGADAAAAMLCRAQRQARRTSEARRPAYVLCDAKQMPFPEAAFDIVISNSILHHIDGVHAFWCETRRVAGPGRCLFLRDLSRPHSKDEAARLVQEYAGTESAMLQEEFYRSLLAAYTPDEVRLQLAAAGMPGLTVTQVTDRHLDVYGTFP